MRVASDCFLLLVWLLTTNKLGICTSYESLEHIDKNLTQRIIRDAGDHRLPILPVINSDGILHGSRENFEDGSCHETILMLLQNKSNSPLSKSISVRRSHWRCSIKKVFLKFCKFHRKTPMFEFLFNKVAGLRPCKFIKKRVEHRCFPVKFAKFLRELWRTFANECRYIALRIKAS